MQKLIVLALFLSSTVTWAGTWPAEIGVVACLDSYGAYINAAYSEGDAKKVFTDVNQAIEKANGVKNALVSAEYMAATTVCAEILSQPFYTTKAKNNEEVKAYFSKTAEERKAADEAEERDARAAPRLTLVRPFGARYHEEEACLQLDLKKGTGCGDVWQGGLQDDELACFRGKTYIRCQLDCIRKIDHREKELDYVPGPCAGGWRQQ